MHDRQRIPSLRCAHGSRGRTSFATGTRASSIATSVMQRYHAVGLDSIAAWLIAFGSTLASLADWLEPRAEAPGHADFPASLARRTRLARPPEAGTEGVRFAHTGLPAFARSRSHRPLLVVAARYARSLLLRRARGAVPLSRSPPPAQWRDRGEARFLSDPDRKHGGSFLQKTSEIRHTIAGSGRNSHGVNN